MKHFFIYSLLFTLLGVIGKADSISFKKTVPIKARICATDPIGNLYVVKENNTLLKLNAHGDSIGFFNEIKKGKIHSIDVSNPLRVLLFFREYNQVVVLNNMLTHKSTLKLNNVGLYNVACMANSADGGIWLYDPSTATLAKISEQLELLQSTNLRNIFENSSSPVQLIEHERSLYITDTAEGIRKFDLFSFYNTTYHFQTKNIQFFTNYLVYYQQPYLISYNLFSFSEKKIELPNTSDLLQVRMARGLLYILRSNQIDIYDLKEN